MSEKAKAAEAALAAHVEAVARLDLLTAEMRTLIDAQIPPEVKAAIAEIEEEYQETLAQAQADAEATKEAAKAAVIAAGTTIKVAGATAAYKAGTAKWDTAALDGYLLHEPALAAFRTDPTPGAAITVRR